MRGLRRHEDVPALEIIYDAWIQLCVSSVVDVPQSTRSLQLLSVSVIIE